MELTLKYLFDDGRTTTGELYADGKPECFTLVPSAKRTPPGRYRITLRKEGGMHPRYRKRYGTDGMIWIREVPGMEYVYLHIGNRAADSDGCQLIGVASCRNADEQYLYQSKKAYIPFHAKIADALDTGKVFLTVV